MEATKHIGIKSGTELNFQFNRMLYTGLVYRYFLFFDKEQMPFDVEGVVAEMVEHGVKIECLFGQKIFSKKGIKNIDLESDEAARPTKEIKRMLQADVDSFPPPSMGHLSFWVRHYAPGGRFYSVPNEQNISVTQHIADQATSRSDFSAEKFHERMMEFNKNEHLFY